MKTRVCLFSRCSTSSQTTENQLKVLREVAAHRDYEVVCEISETVSGAKSRKDREGFDRLIKGAVKAEYDLIMVFDVSRLGRSLQELVFFLTELEASGCQLYIHNSGIDTQTASGKALFGMMAVFASFERELIRDRVKAGLDRARASGTKLGRPSAMCDGLVESIIHMRKHNVPVAKIAKDLKVGVGTVYKVIRGEHQLQLAA